jgi:hypothetical protein
VRSHNRNASPYRHVGAEALIEMYLAGVSARRVEDITEDIELLKAQQMR